MAGLSDTIVAAIITTGGTIAVALIQQRDRRRDLRDERHSDPQAEPPGPQPTGQQGEAPGARSNLRRWLVAAIALGAVSLFLASAKTDSLILLDWLIIGPVATVALAYYWPISRALAAAMLAALVGVRLMVVVATGGSFGLPVLIVALAVYLVNFIAVAKVMSRRLRTP